MSSVLKAANILAAQDLAIVREEIPEWPNEDGTPGVLYFRQLTARETMKLTDDMTAEDRAKDGMFLMIVRTACDENRTPVFTDEDIDALRGKNMTVLNRLQRVALRVNGMIGGVDSKKS